MSDTTAVRQASPQASPWISIEACAKVFGCTPNRARRILANASVRKQQFPGVSPRFYREDINRIANEAVVA